MKVFCDRYIFQAFPNRSLRVVETAMVLLLILFATGPALAADVYWDINDATDGSSDGTTVSETWNATNEFWNTDSTGAGAGTISAWQPGDVAVFSAGTNATGISTVTVSGPQVIGGLRFEEHVNLSGGKLQFTGGATFTHNNGAGDCNINSPVQGSGTLTLAGAGDWGRVNGVISENGGTLSVMLNSEAHWVFGGQHTYSGDTTISGGYAVPTVSSTFSPSTGDLTSGPFGTGTLILTSGILRPTSNGPITIGNAVTLNGNFTFGTSSSSKDLTFTGPLTLTGARTLTTASSTIYFNGALGDGGNNYGFTKAGASTLILGGSVSNTFTGGVTIDNGELRLNNTGALNSTTPNTVTFSSNTNSKVLTLNGNSVTVAGLNNSGGSGAVVQNNAAGTATLTVSNATDNTFAGVLRNGTAGTLALTKTGSGTLTLAGNNTFTGGVTIEGGTLSLANAGALNSTTPNAISFGSNADPKTLRIAGQNVTVSGLTTGATVGTSVVENGEAGTATLTVNNAAANTFAGVLQDGAAGTLALTKTGAGTLTLSGSTANTYTGLTTVSGGTLSLGKSASVNAVAGDIVVNGGTLLLSANHQIANTSSITVNGSANFNPNDRTETVNNLTLNSSYADPNLHRITNVTVNGTLDITKGIVGINSGASATANTLSMSGGSRIDMAANTDSTTLIIGSGGLTMSGATLRLGWDELDSAETALVNLGGDFTGSGANSITYRTLDASRLLDLQNATRTFNITDGVTTIAPTVRNGGITKTGAGTLTLAGNNTFTGGVTIEGGTLSLANAGALNSTTPNAISFGSNASLKTLRIAGQNVTVSGLTTGATVGTSVVENGEVGTATLTVNNAAANTFAGVLQDGAAGTLALTKTGAGTLTLSGSTANTYTGLTTVSGGTLSLGKSASVNAVAGDIVVNGGTLLLSANHQIANTSSITVNGSANFNPNDRTETVNNLTLNSSYADPNLHRITNVTVNGTLDITKGIVGINSGASATANTLSMSGGSRIDMAANTDSTTLIIGSGGLTMSGATLRLGWDELDSAETALVNLGGDFTGSGANSITYRTLDASRLLDLQNATRTFNITGGVTTIAPTVRNGGITKTGAGTLTLTGANTYTGPTTVNDGLLLVNGAHTAGGAYSVQNSGTLGGTGSIDAAVGIGNGGALAPGASIGTLAIGDSLALADGSTFEWEFDSQTLQADLLNVDGDLNLSGIVTLDLIDLASTASELELGTELTMISYAGEWNGGLFEDYANYSKFTAGLNQWRICYNDTTAGLNGGLFGSFVTLTAVPEPCSIFLLVALAVSLSAIRRRRVR